MRLIHSLLVILIITLASCGNCGGVNETIHYYAMTIDNNSDTIKAVNGRYSDELRLTTLSWSEKGDRKCHYKNYVFNFGETIDSNSVKVYCNNDLPVKGIIVSKGENLMSKPELFDYYYSGRIRIVLDNTVAGTVNTYYVSGSTDKGNNFVDSVRVYYQ